MKKLLKSEDKKSEQGFTLIESLVVIVVIGFLFYFLIDALDIEGVQNKARNVSIQSTITKIILSTDSFVTSYNRVPNESEFLSALSSSTIELDQTCTIFGVADYECFFKPGSRVLPKTCDLSNWRFDKSLDKKDVLKTEGERPCYIRYQADEGHYRIYSKAFGKENAFFVFDSAHSGILYKCPGTLRDYDNLEECNEF